MIIKFFCDILWVAHFALIGAYSGMAVSCVGCFREVVFFHRKENSVKSNIRLFLFIFLGIAGVVLTWKNIFCICSLISTVLSTVAYWQTKSERMKILSLGTAVSQLVYAVRFVSYAALVNEVITLLSILIFFIRIRAQKIPAVIRRKI